MRPVGLHSPTKTKPIYKGGVVSISGSIPESWLLVARTPPGLNVSVARLARASLQQKNIRANVDTLTFKPGGGE